MNRIDRYPTSLFANVLETCIDVSVFTCMNIWVHTTMSICLNFQTGDTHTYTHTHIYIYIYIYILLREDQKREISFNDILTIKL